MKRSGSRRTLLYALHLALCIVLLAGCRSVAPPTPLDQLNPQQVQGHDVFQARCGQCHYDRVADPLHGPPLLGLFQRQYLPSGAPANDERVTATILHGRNLMPGQPDLSAQQVTDLLAYLHTL